jgi:hypothetical protein
MTSLNFGGAMHAAVRLLAESSTDCGVDSEDHCQNKSKGIGSAILIAGGVTFLVMVCCFAKCCCFSGETSFCYWWWRVYIPSFVYTAPSAEGQAKKEQEVLKKILGCLPELQTVEAISHVERELRARRTALGMTNSGISGLGDEGSSPMVRTNSFESFKNARLEDELGHRSPKSSAQHVHSPVRTRAETSIDVAGRTSVI